MVDVNLDVKVDQFNACMEQMARVLQGSATKREIVRSEVRSILQKTLETVKVGSEAKIRASFDSRTWSTMNGKKYYLLNWYPDAVWNALKAKSTKAMAIRIASIGWGGRSWYELAISLGLSIDGGRAATAIEPGKDARSYVTSSQEQTDDSYAIRVKNNSTLQAWVNGRTAFFSAIAGRVGYFRQNLAHGVFNDLKQVAAKYPGITVSSG